MKKILSVLMIVGTAFWLSAPTVFAASTVTSGPWTVSTSVDGSLTSTFKLVKGGTTTTATTIDFGKLADIGTGTLRSNNTTGTGYYTMFITPNSHGLPVTISQTGTSLSNGSVTLPTGACTFVPTYAAADNGGLAMPTGATLGSAASWVSASAKTIYTSESGTNVAMRTVQANYSITDDPAAGATTGVPVNQAGGTYTGTVTFTVTA